MRNRLRFKLFLLSRGLWKVYKKQYRESAWRGLSPELNDFKKFQKNYSPKYWIINAFPANEHWLQIDKEWRSRLRYISGKDVFLQIAYFIAFGIVSGFSLFILIRLAKFYIQNH